MLVDIKETRNDCPKKCEVSYLTLLFLLSAAELSVALIVGAQCALVSSCDCEFKLLLALPLLLSSFVVHVEDAMTLLLRILWALLASLAAGEVDDRKALGCIVGWWFKGSSFVPPIPLLTMPFLPTRALLDTRSRLRSLSWKVHFVRLSNGKQAR